MEVRVDTQHVALPRRGAATLAGRIARVFARAAAGVTRVHITLKAIRGGRPGRNKICVLRADLADGGQVVVMDRSAELRRALFRCLRRGRDLIRRELRRRRSRRRLRSRPSLAPQPAA